MYTLLATHYSILKKLYRKRHKDLKLAVFSLAFLCILLLTIFIWTLIIDPSTIWNHPGNRNPIKSRTDLIAIIGVLLILSFIWDGFVKNKVQKLRKVISLTNRLTRSFSFIYLSFYLILFVVSILILIAAKS